MIGKKAVSIIVAYVLLIVIAISLSGLVYNWLRFQVTPSDVEQCPEGVTLIIKELICEGGKINLTLENKGTFTIEGFIIRVNNRTDAEFGVHGLAGAVEEVLVPGNKSAYEIPFDNFVGLVGIPVLLDVQPYVIAENGQKTYCARVSSNDLDCV